MNIRLVPSWYNFFVVGISVVKSRAIASPTTPTPTRPSHHHANHTLDHFDKSGMGDFQLLSENQKLQNVDTYAIPNELDVGDLDERGITRALESKLVH